MPEAENENWKIDLSQSLPSDPLLACLIICTKLFHKPLSAPALVAGLPLVDGHLTPNLFIRAAERAGYASQINKHSLSDLNNNFLPAVLLLDKGKACILLEIEDHNKAKIIQPEMGSGISEIHLNDLSETYSGYVLFIRPSYQFTGRSEETLNIKTHHWFWDVMWQLWPIYSEVLLASLLINLFALAAPLFVMNVYDRVIPNYAMTTLWVLVSGVIIVFLFDFLMRLLRAYFIDMGGKNVDVKLSSAIFEQVLGIKMDSRPRSVGSFTNAVYSFESFRDFITSTTVTVLVDLPFSLLYIFIIALIGGWLALIPIFSMPIIIFVGFFLQAPLKSLTEEAQKHNAEKQATLIESLGNVEAVKAGCGEGVLQRRWEQIVSISARTGIKLRMYANTSINFTMLIQQLAYVFVVIGGVYLIEDHQLTTGGLIACAIITSRAVAPMGAVAALLTRYHQAITSLQSLEKIMELPLERPHGKGTLHRPKLQGNIEFRDVGFVYPQQLLPALHKVSFKINAGEKVAILGRIGSGKTTIAKLLLNLYQPSTGSILVDGTDYQQVDPVVLRHNIAYVPQDITLFYGTIRDNITFGIAHAEDYQILEAARIAGVDKFTATHPQGFDIQVGERGTNLSGGQRQTVAIARAILTDPPILLFDEPTNSMDDMTENQFKESLKSYIKNKTFILITHKASLVSLVDRLIILDNGHLVADGPKDAVIKALSEGRIKSPAPGA